MLAELAIDDLVLIARARLELSPRLNVITGETGAGKTLLAQAVGLLMGQKGGEELIRPGAERALVQALFESGEGTLAVARELPRGGRSRAHLDGLLSSAGAIEEALHERLAFYGQLEHTRLLQLERQLDLLDAFAGDGLAPLQQAYGEAFARAQRLERQLDDLRGAGRERERELDMLRFQAGEIEAAGVEPGEDVAAGAGARARASRGQAARADGRGARAGRRRERGGRARRAARRAAPCGGRGRRRRDPGAARRSARCAERRDGRRGRGPSSVRGRPGRGPGAARRARAALRQAQGADAQVRRVGGRGAGATRPRRASASPCSRSSRPTRSS